jgi:hypothetical protein
MTQEGLLSLWIYYFFVSYFEEYWQNNFFQTEMFLKGIKLSLIFFLFINVYLLVVETLYNTEKQRKPIVYNSTISDILT